MNYKRGALNPSRFLDKVGVLLKSERGVRREPVQPQTLLLLAQAELNRSRQRDQISNSLKQASEWNILLQLFIAHHQQREITLAQLSGTFDISTQMMLRIVHVMQNNHAVLLKQGRQDESLVVVISQTARTEIAIYLRT